MVSDSNDLLELTSITEKDVIKTKSMNHYIFDKISFQYLEFVCEDFKCMATVNIKLLFLAEAIAVDEFFVFMLCPNYFSIEFLILKV